MYLVKTAFGYCLKIEVGHVEISVAFDDYGDHVCTKSEIRIFDQNDDKEIISGPFKDGEIDGSSENLLKAIEFAKEVCELERIGYKKGK